MQAAALARHPVDSWAPRRWRYVAPYLLKLTPMLTFDIGQVSANANIDSAVLPAWRTAKIHVGSLL
jgi:hypothetical protein